MIRLYGACHTCGQQMQILHELQTNHPLCEDRPDALTRMMRTFIQAARAGDEQRCNELAARIETHDERARDLGKSALFYARWGWPVHPLTPGGKVPITKHGCKDATTDTEQITQWWNENPHANIGLATGHAFDVIDVDVPTGALEWANFRDNPKQLWNIYGWVTTPSGGWHAYVEPTGHGNLTSLRPGVDFRGKGGYVVAPPSRTPQGRYVWAFQPSPVIRKTPCGSTT